MVGEQVDGHKRDKQRVGSRSTPWLEWFGAGTGLALALGLFGAIGWQAFDEGDSAPTLVAEVETITQVDGGFRVDIRARNRSRIAAAQIEVEGRLSGGSQGEVETGRITFDYLAGHSARKGGLFFTRDPRSGSLSIRVAGYAMP